MKTVAHRGVYCSILAMTCKRCQNYGLFNKRPVVTVPRYQATKTQEESRLKPHAFFTLQVKQLLYVPSGLALKYDILPALLCSMWFSEKKTAIISLHSMVLSTETLIKFMLSFIYKVLISSLNTWPTTCTSNVLPIPLWLILTSVKRLSIMKILL
jgi:hypothetical protein